MKHTKFALLLMVAAQTVIAQFPPQIKNVVIIFQENRTPDNFFHYLTPACPLPKNPPDPYQACIPEEVTTKCYDISPCGLMRSKNGPVKITLKGVTMGGMLNPNHSHDAFVGQCDPDPATYKCRNDAAYLTGANNAAYSYVLNAPITNYDGSPGHTLDPYLTFAKEYGWANYMYQTNQGPSYPAHQYIFSGTSALTGSDDAHSTFIAENTSMATGCLAQPDTISDTISPALDTPAAGCTTFDGGTVKKCRLTNTGLIFPTDPVGSFCASHKSMADVLRPAKISWKYYAPNASGFWTAPDAIKSLCQPAFADPNDNTDLHIVCTGAEWTANVDTNRLGTDILRDIANCSMSNVSWVIPNGEWSDHPDPGDIYGPSWVAAVINAIGNNPKCPAGTKDAGQKYWENTAIVVTWDDWGGWADNQPPPYASKMPCKSMDCQGDYQFGFRVPLLVVSAYTPAGYINNLPHDFGSILRMVEGVYHLEEGQLGFADKRATNDLRQFFPLRTPRVYKTVPAWKSASFFLTHVAAAVDPDDD